MSGCLYTQHMRRMICICALMRKLLGQGYVWTARPLPRPTPIEWQVPADGFGGTMPAWWVGS
jgi:hypothetical protein